MIADRRTKQYVVAAVVCEVAAVAIALTNNLTRLFSDSLTDLSQMSGSIGLVLVGMAVESIRRLNS